MFCDEPLSFTTMTKEELDIEIYKGIEDINQGRIFTAEEVVSEMKELME